MANQTIRNIGFQVLGDGASSTYTVDIRDLAKVNSSLISIPAPPSILAEGLYGTGSTVQSGPTSPTTTAAVSGYVMTLTFSGALSAGLYSLSVYLIF